LVSIRMKTVCSKTRPPNIAHILSILHSSIVMKSDSEICFVNIFVPALAVLFYDKFVHELILVWQWA
jgi:hypothetical protein